MRRASATPLNSLPQQRSPDPLPHGAAGIDVWFLAAAKAAQAWYSALSCDTKYTINTQPTLTTGPSKETQQAPRTQNWKQLPFQLETIYSSKSKSRPITQHQQPLHLYGEHNVLQAFERDAAGAKRCQRRARVTREPVVPVG
jgi:hypothetical protein